MEGVWSVGLGALHKLLIFFVSQRGIEANPDKIKAIEQIEAPKWIKDVRRLTGCVAAMSRFISKFAERAIPFFKILKKTSLMEWTPEAEAALQDLKKYLSSTPILVAPNHKSHYCCIWQQRIQWLVPH